MHIEFEKQERNETESESYGNNNNNQPPTFVATQNALLFRDGEKYPDKFEYRLYRGKDKNQADVAQPMPAGKYSLKETAFGVSYNNFNCDPSQIEPMKNQQASRAA